MAAVKNIHSARYLFLALMGSIFAGETLIMLFIDLVPSLSLGQKALLDASLLLMLTFPVMYFFAFQPLKNHIFERGRKEEELFKMNARLREHEKVLEERNFELKCANTALNESIDRFTHLFDFAPVGYLVLSEQGVINDVNLTGAMLLGLDKEKLLNTHFGNFLLAEEMEHWESHIQSVLKNNDKQSCKLIMQRHDKNVFYALLDCRRDDALVSPNIHISFTDITKQNWTSFQ